MSIINEETLKEFLYWNVRRESLYYFGDIDKKWISYASDYFWNESYQDFRLADLANNGITPGFSKTLDIAAGCGQFVLRALEAGFDCYGLEPEKWKLEFIQKKIKFCGKPMGLVARFTSGIGESMPYQDNSFDCVTSYQTLEHVQNPFMVISEMVRITKTGGIILIRCPDYRSTYEGHYRLPWLPLMPRAIAKIYLRLLGRPIRGLDTIQYVTQKKIYSWLTCIEEKSGCKLHIFDADFIDFCNSMRRRAFPCPAIGYQIYRFFKYILLLFRKESDVNITIRIIKK